MTTPPGWYPDPGHTGHGPVLERWWDGSAWTGHTRDPQVAGAGYVPRQPAGFGAGADSGRRPGAGSRRTTAAVLVAAAAVLVAAVAGGVVLLGGDGGSSDETAKPSAGSHRPAPEGDGGATAGGDGTAPAPGPSGVPDTAPDLAPDPVNGIGLPVLPGWDKTRSSSGGAGVTIGAYPCPGDSGSSCVRGGVFTRTATGYQATTPKGIAEEDIARNAEDSYGEDPESGKQMYGGVLSHRRLKAAAVTVVGRKGYLVRWKVETKKGGGGYVESLVFPSPVDHRSMVLVRFGFDASEEAPPLTDMDTITAGIRPVSASGGDTGTGEAV